MPKTLTISERRQKKLREQQSALSQIHALLDGVQWDSQTTSDIADVMREAGFTIRSPEEMDREAKKKRASR